MKERSPIDRKVRRRVAVGQLPRGLLAPRIWSRWTSALTRLGTTKSCYTDGIGRSRGYKTETMTVSNWIMYSLQWYLQVFLLSLFMLWLMAVISCQGNPAIIWWPASSLQSIPHVMHKEPQFLELLAECRIADRISHFGILSVSSLMRAKIASAIGGLLC